MSLEFKSEDFPVELYKTDREIAVQAPSWFSNPKTPFEQFQKAFEKDYVTAARDFGARPVASYNAYFSDPEIVERRCNRERKSPIDEMGSFALWFRPMGFSYYLAIDLGIKSDATGLVLVHPEGNRIIVDLVHRFVPLKEAEVRFSDIIFFIKELQNRGFFIKLVTTDSFQSLNFVQSLTEMGLECEVYSVDRNMQAYEVLKSLIIEDRIDYYNHAVLIKELKELVLISNKRIDHPKDGSKDCSDALASCCFHAVAECSNSPFFFSSF